MTSSWISNFAGVNQTYIPTDNTNIDDIFKKREEDVNVIKMIKLKELLVDIIQSKEEIDFNETIEGDDGGSGSDDEGGDNDMKEDIHKFMKTVDIFIQDFLQQQRGLDQINNSFQLELKTLQQNISTIENMISFLQKLPDNHKEEQIMENIIDNMNQLSNKILKNEKIKELKKEYLEKRKIIEKYIYLIKKLNNFNHCNICPLCFTNTVDHFLDPCGHTFCKSCIQEHIRKNGELDLYQVGRNDNSQCCYCREKIKTVRQLYFL